MFDMFSKLGEIKEKANQLSSTVSAQSFSASDHLNSITISVNGKKDITSIKIHENFQNLSKSEQEKAILEASQLALNQSEVFIKNELKNLIPNIPGMNLF